MKPKLTAQRDEKLIMVKASGRLAGDPSTPDIDHERAVRFQRSTKCLAKRFEPLNVVMRVDVSVVFFPDETKGWTRHD